MPVCVQGLLSIPKATCLNAFVIPYQNTSRLYDTPKNGKIKGSFELKPEKSERVLESNRKNRSEFAGAVRKEIGLALFCG